MDPERKRRQHEAYLLQRAGQSDLDASTLRDTSEVDVPSTEDMMSNIC